MKRLYRSRKDAKLFGVCGGLADAMNVDPTLVRIVVVVTTFFSAGTTIPLYIIASLVIPKEPLFHDPNVGAGFEFRPGGFQGTSRGFQHQHQDMNGFRGEYNGSQGNPGPAGFTTAGHSVPPQQGYRPHDPFTHQQGTPGGMRSTGDTEPKPTSSSLDEMMKDIEKKAMQKEIEELRTRLAKLENQNQNNNNPRGDE